MDFKIYFKGESDEKWKNREDSIWVKATLFLSGELTGVNQEKDTWKIGCFFLEAYSCRILLECEFKHLFLFMQ